MLIGSSNDQSSTSEIVFKNSKNLNFSRVLFFESIFFDLWRFSHWLRWDQFELVEVIRKENNKDFFLLCVFSMSPLDNLLFSLLSFVRSSSSRERMMIATTDDDDESNMFAFPRSFSLEYQSNDIDLLLLPLGAFLFVDERNLEWIIMFFFLCLSLSPSLSAVFTRLAMLCSNNSSSATNYKMIKSFAVYARSIVFSFFFFFFFFSL